MHFSVEGYVLLLSICITSSFNCSATTPSFTYVSIWRQAALCAELLLPDCTRFSCCSPNVSALAAAPQLRPLRLLLPDCVHFGCCSLIASASTVAPDCVHSAAAPCLLLLQLLLADCIRFSFCSPLHPFQLLLPIASASAAAPDCIHVGYISPIASPNYTCMFQPLPKVLAFEVWRV